LKDLGLIFFTTLFAISVWIVFESRQAYYDNTIGKELQKISSPISGTIDVKFVESLNEDSKFVF